MTRILPHSLEAEMSVVGGILLHSPSFVDVADLVTAADFYHPTHGAIYAAMAALDAAGQPIDMLTVAQRMRRDETFAKLRSMGGEPYFAELMQAVVTVENIRHYAKTVASRAFRRRLMEAAKAIEAAGYRDDLDDAEHAADAEQAILGLSLARDDGKPATIKAILANVLREVDRRAESPGEPTGVRTGLHEIDRRTLGLQPGDLVIVAARPSMGKTSLALNIVGECGEPSLVFSREMTKEDIVEQILCIKAGLSRTALRSGAITDRDHIAIAQHQSRVAALPIEVDDSAQSMSAIAARARRWRADRRYFPVDRERPLGVVVVDYLQLVHAPPGSDNREQQIAAISRGLKQLAKDLHLPVVALAQLNRDLERRADKRPTLADLRESGQIEQDADVIMFLYRDEVYNKDSDDKGVCEIIIGKQRKGPIGTVRVGWQDTYGRFVDLDERRSDPIPALPPRQYKTRPWPPSAPPEDDVPMPGEEDAP